MLNSKQQAQINIENPEAREISSPLETDIAVPLLAVSSFDKDLKSKQDTSNWKKKK